MKRATHSQPTAREVSVRLGLPTIGPIPGSRVHKQESHKDRRRKMKRALRENPGREDL